MKESSVLNGLPVEIAAIVAENNRRNAAILAKFNPITGEGSIGKRVKLEIEDFPLPVQYIPERMMRVPLVRQLAEAGTIDQFLFRLVAEVTEEERQKVGIRK